MSEGERQWLVARSSFNWRPDCLKILSDKLIDVAAQAANCRMVEKRDNRKIDVQNSAQFHDDLNRQERMTTEFKKACLNSEILQMENSCPNASYDLLRGGKLYMSGSR